MRKEPAKILISFILVLFFSCDDPRLNFDKAIIPFTPRNFSDVNSAYDDYNSDIFRTGSSELFSLVFSTNRNSLGLEFDFTHYLCTMTSSLITGEFELWAYYLDCSLTDTINSQDNELGPNLTFDFISGESEDTWNDTRRFFYSTDKNGNYDIWYNYYTADYHDFSPVGDPAELTGINTSYDEGYLTIHPGENTDRETIYFTSNRDNTYDIYRAVGEENKSIEESLIIEVNKVAQLSSNADDKCPYISENLMVFASDRDGGYGGFDLWFSVYDGTDWSDPVNFGETINTENDEYRPVVIRTNKDEFFNDFMIFSSDRPGGKGMFDLYIAGMSKHFN